MVENVREKCFRIEGGLSSRQLSTLRKAALLWTSLNDDLLVILEHGVIDLFTRYQVNTITY